MKIKHKAAKAKTEDMRHPQGDPYQASMAPDFPQPGMTGPGGAMPPTNEAPPQQ